MIIYNVTLDGLVDIQYTLLQRILHFSFEYPWEFEAEVFDYNWHTTEANEGGHSEENEDFSGSTTNSRYKELGEETEDRIIGKTQYVENVLILIVIMVHFIMIDTTLRNVFLPS